MDIKQARKLLGKSGVGQTNEQIQGYIDTAKLLSEIASEQFIKMTPEERKKYSKK